MTESHSTEVFELVVKVNGLCMWQKLISTQVREQLTVKQHNDHTSMHNRKLQPTSELIVSSINGDGQHATQKDSMPHRSAKVYSSVRQITGYKIAVQLAQHIA